MLIPRTPSILRIIWTDFYAMLAAVFLFPFLVLVAIFLGIPLLLDPKLAVTIQNFLVVLVAMAFWIVLFGGWLALRISTIRSTFNDGQEVKGQITAVDFVRDHGQVKYTYVYMGTLYASSNRIMKNGRTRQLAAGNEATVMVDTGDPRRAFLMDIYL